MLILVGIVIVMISSIIYFSIEESETKIKYVSSWNGVYEYNDLQRPDKYGNIITDVKCIITNHTEQTCEFYFENEGGGSYIWMSKTSHEYPLTDLPHCGVGTLLIGGVYCVGPSNYGSK